MESNPVVIVILVLGTIAGIAGAIYYVVFWLPKMFFGKNQPNKTFTVADARKLLVDYPSNNFLGQIYIDGTKRIFVFRTSNGLYVLVEVLVIYTPVKHKMRTLYEPIFRTKIKDMDEERFFKNYGGLLNNLYGKRHCWEDFARRRLLEAVDPYSHDAEVTFYLNLKLGYFETCIELDPRRFEVDEHGNIYEVESKTHSLSHAPIVVEW